MAVHVTVGGAGGRTTIHISIPEASTPLFGSHDTPCRFRYRRVCQNELVNLMDHVLDEQELHVGALVWMEWYNSASRMAPKAFSTSPSSRQAGKKPNRASHPPVRVCARLNRACCAWFGSPCVTNQAFTGKSGMALRDVRAGRAGKRLRVAFYVGAATNVWNRGLSTSARPVGRRWRTSRRAIGHEKAK